MSKWFEPTIEDMLIDGDKINIYVTSDNDGSIYAEVKIEDIKSLLEKGE